MPTESAAIAPEASMLDVNKMAILTYGLRSQQLVNLLYMVYIAQVHFTF